MPLGALADAYLDALATLDGDRMGNGRLRRDREPADPDQVRAMLPRHRDEAATTLADDGPDPEAELRARLILYRAYRDAGTRLLEDAQGTVGLWHREAGAARAAGVAGARPPAAAPMPVSMLVDALDALAVVVPRRRGHRRRSGGPSRSTSARR